MLLGGLESVGSLGWGGNSLCAIRHPTLAFDICKHVLHQLAAYNGRAVCSWLIYGGINRQRKRLSLMTINLDTLLCIYIAAGLLSCTGI